MARIKHTDEEIADAVLASMSWAGVCRIIGVKPATGAQTHIKSRAVKAQIDFSHFTGQGWRKNRRFNPRRSVQDYLTLDGLYIKSHELKLRLIKSGLKEARCEICKLDQWQQLPIPLELDHINGNHDDNRFENLRILCPNCHAQTSTYCSKNISRTFPC